MCKGLMLSGVCVCEGLMLSGVCVCKGLMFSGMCVKVWWCGVCMCKGLMLSVGVCMCVRGRCLVYMRVQRVDVVCGYVYVCKG